MNIQKLIELENLKSKKQNLLEEISKIICFEKIKLLNSTKADFKDYFILKGFKTIDDSNGCNANYGQQNVTIFIPNPEDTFFGGYSVIELVINGSIRKNYTILVNEFGNHLAIKSTDRIIPNNEEDRINAEIKDVQEQIEQLEKRKNNLGEFCLGYRIYDKDEAKKNPFLKIANTKQFKDFKELLDSIFA